MAPYLVSDTEFQISSNFPQTPLCHITTPVGMLGYGFDASLIHATLVDLKIASPNIPTALILDSGSTDSGPAKLALGGMTCPRSAYERDIGQLMSLAHEFDVPILISSAGGDGTDKHVDEFLDIIQEQCEILGNEAYNFKTLAIYSNVSKTIVSKSLQSGSITGCGSSVPALTQVNINDAVTIVAQMGPEPFLDAMTSNPDFNIVISGRAYDPAPYVAFSIFYASQTSSKTSLTDAQIGGFTHMGKIMECGALCATPKAKSSMATVYLDGSFDIKPLDAGTRCTPASVASHTLYEKSRPDILAGPGGNLDLRGTRYMQLPDEISVHVEGATFSWLRDIGAPYTVKLEAARVKGFRTIFMGGIRDPIMIKQIDNSLERIKEHLKKQNKNIQGEWDIGFHVYGGKGIMGSLEPLDSDYFPREIFIVGEVLAPTQTAANAIASSARVGLVHGSYPGQRGTGGNLAMGIGGKMEIEMGPCAEFCVYHLMSLAAGTEGARQISGNCDEPTNGAVAKSSPTNTKVLLPKLQLTTSTTLAEIAPVIRSKNSGPYDITLDVVFSSLPVYNIIKKSDLLAKKAIARLYHLDESAIIWCGFFDQAMAFKATIPRMRDGKFVSSGAYMETDVHASQQYAGLLDLKLGEEICEKLRELDLSILD
ncbi:hypothetical protein DL98DRAFT_402406 [Cadophora sp. DSE1049]|nr:hypothetical protein DL98DRAFT_402406 [Cadophora sp. DSE1049]